MELLVGFGTATGNAEALGQRICDAARAKGYKCQLAELNDYAKIDFSVPRILIIVCATTGEGDVPDNAIRFSTFIRRRAHPTDLMQHLWFTVLALGDTNYSRFCNAGRSIDTRLAQLGGHCFYPRGDADDGTDMGMVIEPWIEALWPALAEASKAVASGDSGAASEATPAPAPTHAPTASAPAVTSPAVQRPATSSARILTSRRLTPPDVDRSILHVAIEANGQAMGLQPGDAVAVHCENRPEEVEWLLRRLNITEPDAAATFTPARHLPDTATSRQLLSTSVELRGVLKKKTIKEWAETAKDTADYDKLLHLASPAGAAQYREVAAGRCMLITLLHTYKFCTPTLAQVVESLPAIRPRMFSLTNCPSVEPNRLDFVLTVVDVPDDSLPEGRFHGTCTTWMNQLHHTFQTQPDTAPSLCIAPKPTPSFHLPEDPSLPVIMIGPGTGVAPFRGFLQAHKARGGGGQWSLFTGFREPSQAIFLDEFGQFEQQGLVSVSVSYSRVGPNKVYVQDAMRERQEALAQAMLDNGGHVYVCGDGAAMAKDVQSAWVEIVQNARSVPVEEARKIVLSWIVEKRYHVDLFS